MGKSRRRWMRVGLSAILLAAALTATARAPAAAQSMTGPILSRSNLLGNAGGLRSALNQEGVTLNITDSENLLGNTLGGVKQGATMEGVTTGVLEINTGAFGWQNGTFHVSALQIHGQNLSGPYLDNLQAANGNEAEQATRLWELWFEQSFRQGKIDLKIGQQSIDNEFMASTYSGLFVNTMAGWPLLPSFDLYGGGPAYPLASLGVRVRLQPTVNQTILAGVFDDNPGGGGFDQDQQFLDRNGGRFNLNTGALFIAEYQVAINQPKTGQMVAPGAPSAGLPGIYKLGFWVDTGAFPDQRYGSDGLSLADPASNGNPIMHHGNYSIYAVADQTVWQSLAEPGRGLNVFGRIMGAPDTQNDIDFFFNGGLTLTAPFPGRASDQAGIDFGLGKVSGQSGGLDADAGAPRQTTEELIELTYQAQLVPWLVLQPDFQYIVNPGGGVLDPVRPTHKLRNELVAGARAVVTF